MGKVVIDMSMSLDGFVAGPNDTPEDPLGKGGLVLHDWLSDPQAFNKAYGSKAEAPGAVIMGWRTYQNSQPWWHGKGPMGDDTPCFVLTETPPAKSGSMFTFVTEGIESALSQARAAAGDSTIGLMGANVDQQFLKAGLVDEIHIHLIPVLLGGGLSLFNHLGKTIRLKKIAARDAPEGTHLAYEVL